MKDFQYIDIANRIESMINNDTYPLGEKLPSLRVLSGHFGVSVGTSLKAYGLLIDKGLLSSREKSGYVPLRKSTAHTAQPVATTAAPAIREINVSRIISKMPVDAGPYPPGFLSFFNASLETHMIPFNAVRRSLQKASRDLTGAHLQYESTLGNQLLREQIARLSFYWNGSLSANEILVTNGTLEALSLCLRAVTQPGDTVVVESPCYYGILQCLEQLQLKVIELPCDPQEGIDTGQLEDIIDTYDIAACLFISNFNNPNGVLLSDEKKKWIAEMARKRQLPVIEDDVYGELYFGPARPTTIKTYDKHGWVMLCASFSKTVASGYRIGWSAPGRFLEKVAQLKATTNVATATVLQLSLADLLTSGTYQRHLRKLRPLLHKQVLLTSQHIEQYFPSGIKISQPEGGIVLWVELPKQVDALKLQKLALEQDINIAPGPLFSSTGGYRNYIRISCNKQWNRQVEQAIRKLGKLVGTF
ncbi:PLP-dependent aminotransferase family protein [Chitinophaga qingshengii]|uniref:PLP-dependent aminotransferase family protein n=1 Tax=Chitinophaga qingshengii TaxID=1569794 RepID=A0ABR7TQY1_9BACT|nr:PLP-dependent aminotransferase family protein [Chitinophaga qingshengii]MBC9932899.1 PLP-dependent aminotransferase family protein [Chitinophaga qingshengii]